MVMENEMKNNNDSVMPDTNEDLIEKERFSDVQNIENSEIGSQETEKELFEEEQDNKLEGKARAENAEGAIEEADGALEEAADSEEATEGSAEGAYQEAGGDREDTEGALKQADADSGELYKDSVSGESAEYVWNSSERTRSAEELYSEQPKEDEGALAEKKERRRKNAIVAALGAIVSLLLVVALVGGAAFGYMIARDIEEAPEKDGVTENKGEGDKNIDMTKNDGSVNVTIGSTGQTDLSKSEVVALVADAVVEITTSVVQTNPYYGNYVTSGAGSGVVIAQSGEYAYIVTNYHVIDGASSASVILTDGTKIDAEYLDGDANYDIAMIRIKRNKKFPNIVCGSSESLKVGDDVLAIGNPLGQLGGTVTEGIISALDRELMIGDVKMTLLQTSAAVNPGNSGGGLFNMAGELVGIVNAKKSAEGIEGLGFAIPIDIVYDKLVEIIENGYIHGRASLGIETEYVSEVMEAISKYSLRATGIFVTSSSVDGVKAKDYLYAINGQRITDSSTYAAVISSLKIGDEVELTLYRVERSSAVEVKVEVTVVEYVPSGIFG